MSSFVYNCMQSWILVIYYSVVLIAPLQNHLIPWQTYDQPWISALNSSLPVDQPCCVHSLPWDIRNGSKLRLSTTSQGRPGMAINMCTVVVRMCRIALKCTWPLPDHQGSTGRVSSIGSEFAWHASGPEFDPHVQYILSWRLGHENISTAILPLPLIQEERLSVTGESMCTKYW